MSKIFPVDSRELRVRAFVAFGNEFSASLTVSWPYWLCGDDPGHLIYSSREKYDSVFDLLDGLRLMVHDAGAQVDKTFKEQRINRSTCYRWPRRWHQLVDCFVELEKLYDTIDVLNRDGVAPEFWPSTNPVEAATLSTVLSHLVLLSKRARAQNQ